MLAVEAGPLFLPLLLPPLLAVHRAGAIALEREKQALTDALGSGVEQYDVTRDRNTMLEVTEGSLFAESHRAAQTLRRLEQLCVARARRLRHRLVERQRGAVHVPAYGVPVRP